MIGSAIYSLRYGAGTWPHAYFMCKLRLRFPTEENPASIKFNTVRGEGYDGNEDEAKPLFLHRRKTDGAFIFPAVKPKPNAVKGAQVSTGFVCRLAHAILAKATMLEIVETLNRTEVMFAQSFTPHHGIAAIFAFMNHIVWCSAERPNDRRQRMTRHLPQQEA